MALKSYTRRKSQQLTANFSSGEFDCKGSQCKCTATRLDSRLVRRLQMLRRMAGREIFINSGNRCTSHNRRVGGSSSSYHLSTKGKAADIVISGMTPAQMAKLAQQAGFTGVGKYDGVQGHFVHVDVRPTPYCWVNTSGTDRPVSGHGGQLPRNPHKVGTRTLRTGARGEDVKAVQWVLNYFGFRCAVDGIFGSETKAAVEAFQQELRLKKDGIAGPQTLEAVREVTA